MTAKTTENKKEQWVKPDLLKLNFKDTYRGTDQAAPEASGPATYS